MCNCFPRAPYSCTNSIFPYGGGWRCLTSETSTSTTTLIYTTTTSTSTTTTTSTTTLPIRNITVYNNTSYDYVYYNFYNATNPEVASAYLSAGQYITNSSFRDNQPLTLYVSNTAGTTMYITTHMTITGNPDVDHNFSTGVITFTDTGIPGNVLNIVLTITEVSPTTTTTSTSTTSTSTTSTTTTSTSTTSTTTTTTSTTTQAPDNLTVRVKNIGSAPIGFNNTAWNIESHTPPTPSTQTQYYTSSGSALTAGNTQTFYNNDIEPGNQTRYRFENTGARDITVFVYWSSNNGSTYTLLDAYDLIGHVSPNPYPFKDATYTTVPNDTGVNNILEIRVISS